MSNRTNITASEKEKLTVTAEAEKVRPLNEKEIESVHSVIGGMTDQEKILATNILPINLLFDRIQNEIAVNGQKVSIIAAISSGCVSPEKLSSIAAIINE